MSQLARSSCRAGYAQGVAEASSAAALRVPAQPAYLPLIGTIARWFGARAGLSQEKCLELDVALDEVCTNVIRHAFAPDDAGEMTVLFTPCEEGLRVCVVDKGRPFCPEQAVAAASEKRLRDPASGGAGLLLIDRLTDATDYRWDEQDGNCRTLIKHK